jgi:hypothetical protein
MDYLGSPLVGLDCPWSLGLRYHRYASLLPIYPPHLHTDQTASGIGYVYQMSISANVPILSDEAIKLWGILFFAFTLATNASVMFLIGLRAWYEHP